MRKASKALKGGVVLGLSAATFIAYGGTAFAATTPAATAISITPPTTGTTTNTGFCTDNYTASVTPSTATGTLDVTITQPAAVNTGTEDLCGGSLVTSGVNSAGSNFVTYAFTVGSNGTIQFSATDSTAETDAIRVFNDVNSDGVWESGEANASTTATFISNSGDTAVHSLSVSPTTAKARPGDRVHFIVTAINGNNAVPVSDQGVSGAQVWYVVTGPDAQGPTACGGGTTASDGTVHCGVTLSGSATASGTDTVTFFVNNGPNSGPGVDTGDSQTTATINNIGPAPAGDTLTAFCDQNSNNSGRTCTQSIDTTNPNNNNAVSEEFFFDVLDPASNPLGLSEDRNGNSVTAGVTNHTDDFGADTVVTYTMTGASSGATLSLSPGGAAATQNDCFTHEFLENGEAACQTQVYVNEPNPTPGEVITVTGTIKGTTQTASSTLTLNPAPETARNITLNPPTQNVVAGHTGVLTATVTDAHGNPVPNVIVDFSTTGQGAFTSGCILSATCVTEVAGGSGIGPFGGLPATNSHGQVQVQVSSNTTGTEAVSATIDPDQDPNSGGIQGSQCGDAAGFVNGEPVTGVGAGNCTATATVNYVAAPPPAPKISERPHLSGHKNGHTVHLRAATHPNLRHRVVHFYIVRNGINHLVASHGTGSTGVAHATIRHLKRGHYTFVARVVKLGSHYVSHFSNRIHKHIT